MKLGEGSNTDFDRLRRRVLWGLTSGIYVIGSHFQDSYNLMTANLVIQVAVEPKLVGVAIERESLTHRLISASSCFSICVVRKEQREIIRKFVKPSGALEEGRLLGGYEVFFGSSGCPILVDCGSYLDLRLIQELPYESHSFFIGEVEDAGFPNGQEFEPLRISDTRMHYGG